MTQNKRFGANSRLLGLLTSFGIGLVGIANETNAGPITAWILPGSIGSSSANLTWTGDGSTDHDNWDFSWIDMPGNPNPQWSQIATLPYGTLLQTDNRHTSYTGGYTFNLIMNDLIGSGANSSGDRITINWDGTGAPVSDYSVAVSIWGTGSPSSPYYTDYASSIAGGWQSGTFNINNIPDGWNFGTVTFTPVPEPTTFGLMAAGAVALATLRRKRDKKERKDDKYKMRGKIYCRR